MIEIHQSNYNPDELAMEVILSIIAYAESDLTPQERRVYDIDIDVFHRVQAGDDSNATRDVWQSAEDYWQGWGRTRNISVYDDGEAGWTYVGTTEEIEEFLNKQEEQA